MPNLGCVRILIYDLNTRVTDPPDRPRFASSGPIDSIHRIPDVSVESTACHVAIGGCRAQRGALTRAHWPPTRANSTNCPGLPNLFNVLNRQRVARINAFSGRGPIGSGGHAFPSSMKSTKAAMNNWKFVPVESLVSEDALTRAQAFDLDRHVVETTVRGLTFRWLAPSKRLLWMAAGLEYIEPELLDWIDRLPPGSVYYDFGASNGIFALYAAKRGLKVIAIEPDPSNYFLLSWNAYLNAQDGLDLQAFNVAASDRFAVDRLFIRKMELGAHEKIVGQPSLVSGETFAPNHVHAIQVVHFDRWREQFGLPQAEYVKIDVDGHEVPLIDGAAQGLGACRQLLIEIEDAKMDLLTHRLGELGLTIASKHPVQNYAGLWNCIFVR